MKKRTPAILPAVLALFAAGVSAAAPAEEGTEPGREDFEEGILHERGLDGYLKEPSEAAACYRRAAEKGLASAKVRLGDLLAEGAEGLEADPRAAFALYGEAAREGDPDGMERIGTAYAFGNEAAGVDANAEQAVKWLEKAVRAGNVRAKTSLGRVLLSAGAGAEGDGKRGMDLLAEAADAGDADAAYAAANELFKWDDESEKARVFLIKAANGGHLAAKNECALCFAFGRHGFEPNPALAERLLSDAAEAGSDTARRNLGLLLANGSGGLAKDEMRGLQLILDAANGGYRPAMEDLGDFYAKGRFFVRDPVKAREWYRKAGVNKSIPAADPAPVPGPAPAARDDRTTVRVVAGKTPAVRTHGGFFPVGGATLGGVTLPELRGKGGKPASGQYASKCVNYLTMDWWDHDNDGICESIYTVQGETMPEEWKALGMDWGMSYDRWLAFFRGRGFSVKTTKGPSAELYQGKYAFTAETEAQSGDGSLQFVLRFNYGNRRGEGYGSTSPNTLYSITVKARR